jgi:hypothetical protein
METAPQPVLSIEDPERRKKRGFWIWNVAISGVLMVVLPLIVMLISLIGMRGAFGALGTSGADVGALSNHIGQMLGSVAIAMCLSVVAFIWMVLAIVRLCTLPKPSPTFVRNGP